MCDHIYMYILVFIFSFVLPEVTAVNEAHEFHISKLNIHYNPKSSKLEMTLHLFIDDLEAAMIKSGFPVSRLETDNEDEKDHAFIASYLSSKIKLTIGRKPVTFTYLGKEEAERFDAVFIYLESDKIISLHDLSVDNQLFLESFDDQKNIVSVYDDKKLLDFFILNKKQTHHQIKQ